METENSRCEQDFRTAPPIRGKTQELTMHLHASFKIRLGHKGPVSLRALKHIDIFQRNVRRTL